MPVERRATPRRGLLRAAFAAVMALLALAPASVSAADQTISDSPLQITASDTMAMTVFRNEDLVDRQPQLFGFDKQYFDTYNTYLRLTTGGSTAVFSSGNFTPISNTTPAAGTIVTSVAVGNGVAITQTITYVSGEQRYRHDWLITNSGNFTYTGVALRYGGDTYFLDDDQSSGGYDSATATVYCFNPGKPGLMGMYALPSSPSSHYYEDGYTEVVDALAAAPDLLDTVNPARVDNGMGLQWDIGTLAPGDQVTISAIEKWDSTSTVTITAPAETTADVGQQVPLDFIVTNQEDTPDTFDLAVSGTAGLTFGAIPASVSLASGASSTVTVVVTATATAANAIGTVSLTASSRRDSSLSNQNNALLDVSALVTVAPATGVTPSIPVSGGQPVFTPVCPGTPEGLAALSAAMSGLPPSEAVCFWWDAAAQAYQRLPAAPAGGFLPSSGFFIATRHSLGLDFSGTATALPFAIVLQPGWNLVGIAPLDDSGTILTSHAFPADFELLNESSALVTTKAEFADLIGTVGSGDDTTAEPYLFDGATSAYTRTATLTTGTGYWIKNNAPSPITLRRVLNAAPLSLIAAAPRGLSSGGKPASGALHDRGQPPAAPTASAGASGSRCGGGAAIAGLMLVGLALRRRSDNR